MGGLEIALLAAGFAGVAVFTSLSFFFVQKRAERRAQEGVRVPELEARLRPADVKLEVRVHTNVGPFEAGTRIVVEGVCAASSNRNVNIRSGPGTNYARLALLQAGNPIQVTGQSQDGQWFVVQNEFVQGWVAARVVSEFHTSAAAADAAAEFERVHARRELPINTPTVEVSFEGDGDKALTRVICDVGLATSTSEASRKVQQGAVRLDGARVTDPQLRLAAATLPTVLQVGRRVVRLVVGPG